jgi:hypothetical protein
MKLKQCTKCSETKLVSEFYKDRKGKDGFRGDCRSCHKEISRRWKGANKEKAAEITRRWKEDNPKQSAYAIHKCSAKKRGVEFVLTFEEWRDWWGDDFANRGKAKGKLVMARHGDEGPYALGNIKKITCSENLRERHEFSRKSKDKAMSEVQGCG